MWVFVCVCCVVVSPCFGAVRISPMIYKENWMHGFHFERVHGFVNGVAIPDGDEMSACVCRGFPLPIGAGNTCEEHGCVETNATSALRLVAGTYFASLLSGERGHLVEPDSSFACAADEYLVVASKYDPLSGECFKPGAHEYQEGCWGVFIGDKGPWRLFSNDTTMGRLAAEWVVELNSTYFWGTNPVSLSWEATATAIPGYVSAPLLGPAKGFSFSSTNVSTPFSLTAIIENPVASGDYWLMIRGLVDTDLSFCPSVRYCPLGWGGVDCTYPVRALSNIGPLSISSPGSYFSLLIPPSNTSSFYIDCASPCQGGRFLGRLDALPTREYWDIGYSFSESVPPEFGTAPVERFVVFLLEPHEPTCQCHLRVHQIPVFAPYPKWVAGIAFGLSGVFVGTIGVLVFLGCWASKPSRQGYSKVPTLGVI